MMGRIGFALIAALVLGTTHAASSLAQMTGPMASGAGSMQMDRTVRTFLLADVLEYDHAAVDRALHFEGLAWIGGDYHRIWIRALAEQPTTGGGGKYQADAFYGRLISPFWTALVGGRLDTRSFDGKQATRGVVALGLEGLAPYWFELEPTLYVSQSGDVSARVETAFDLLFSQRFIVQPRVEFNAALQAVPAFGVGSGLNDIEVGARARYEFRREFAPYVGFNWRRRTGGTAALVRRAGESVGEGSIVVGVRLWR
jgi:copper resistance protein B